MTAPYSWAELGLDPGLTKTITSDLKFDRVTKVQAAVIPLLLANKDVCVKACTGSGKTLAFGIPLVQTLLNYCNKNDNIDEETGKLKVCKNEVLALLLAPSRELAKQIMEVLKGFE